MIKLLLAYAANVDLAGVDGMNPLIRSARKNNIDISETLLAHGANVNAGSSAGQSPLTTAVIYNSHDVLELLVDRLEYTRCSRLKTSHLLELVARNADLRTMNILSGAEHLLMVYDKRYTPSSFTHLLSQRLDASEKLIKAFDDLLSFLH